MLEPRPQRGSIASRPPSAEPTRRASLSFLTLTLTLALAGTGEAAIDPKLVPTEAPISAVTVYSDRARVTRSAKVTLPGGAEGQRVQLPILMQTVDPASIRVEVQGAGRGDVAVQRVEIGHVEASELPLPVGEAEKLLADLDRIDDQLAQAQSEQSAYSAQLRLLGRVLPSSSGLGAAAPGTAPPPRLNPSGWPAVMQLVRQAMERAQSKSRELDEQLRVLRLKRQELVDKGQKLGGLSRRSGYRVTATLSGTGSAVLLLSYMAYRARWQPIYDIQLQPAQNRVELSLAGLVSQETGEDWTDAALTLSTAVPATATQLPKLLSWKLGERERFIPTPAPQREAAPPPPSAPRLVLLADADPGEALRRRLLQRLGMSATGDEIDGMVMRMPAKQEPVATLDVTKTADKRPAAREEAKASGGKRAYDFDEDQVEGELIRPDGEFESTAPAAPAPEEPAPPPPPILAGAPARIMAKRRYSPASGLASGYDAGSVVGVGLAPPPRYVPPSYDPSLPASLAGGYDLVFPGLYRDTIKSGQGARRVALLSRTFPVAVSRKLLPALAPEAFLVAEIRNPGNEPLPGGRAQLFVGADPAGVAQLKLIAPGEVFTLPLGLDRAIRPVRNVNVTTIEKGLINKDEISEYVVTTEVTNPYRLPIDVKLHDQIPIVGDKNVEIRLVRTDPQAKLDDKKGSLDWRLTIAPGVKITTTFVYTLKRPKGYRLNQSQY
jgi:hypothetical protein